MKRVWLYEYDFNPLCWWWTFSLILNYLYKKGPHQPRRLLLLLPGRCPKILRVASAVHEMIISCALIVRSAAKTWRIVGNWLNSYHALESPLQIGLKLDFTISLRLMYEASSLFWWVATCLFGKGETHHKLFLSKSNLVDFGVITSWHGHKMNTYLVPTFYTYNLATIQATKYINCLSSPTHYVWFSWFYWHFEIL